MSNNDHNFLRQLMKRIVESHQIPKVQVERVVTPILSLFIADILTKKFETNELLKGKYEFVSMEFPIKKEDNYGSINVDFLLFNTTTLSMVFLEIKTDSKSWDGFQFEKYLIVRDEVKKYGSGFLLRNLDLIERRSSRSDKYKILQKSISSFEDLMVKSVDLKLLYLGPKKLKSKLINDGRLDFVMTFSELPDKIDGDLKEEWLIVREALIKLDSNMEESGFDDSLSDTPMYTPSRNVSTFSNRNGNEKMEVRVRRQI